MHPVKIESVGRRITVGLAESQTTPPVPPQVIRKVDEPVSGVLLRKVKSDAKPVLWGRG